MKVRALFREYDYPSNTVSGLQGSPVLTGTGTHFTELKENTLIDIEDYGFAGNILSVQNDTTLTLDRPLNENINDKIYWQDWSAYLVALSPSSRKTESKQPGKAGVQVYDNMSLGFLSFPTMRVGGVDIDNPVTAAFQLDLDNRNRYLIRLQALRRGLKQVPIITSTYQQLIDNLGNYLSANIRQDEVETFFEGMIDFETIDELVLIDSQGESISTISFDIMDKLSAVTLLDNQVKQRGDLLSATARLGVNYNVGYGITKITGTNVGTIYAISTWKVEYNGNQAVRGEAVGHPETILKKGETFLHPDLEGKKDKVYFVIDCGFTNVNGVSTTWIKVSGADEFQYDPANWYQFIPQLNYYPATYYGLSDICNYAVDSYGRMIVKSFNSAMIIKAMLNAFWGDIGDNLVNGASIPLDYFEQLIDAEPFSQAPYDALQYLVDSNNSYFFIDRIGKAVLQKRKDFASVPAQNDKVIPIMDLDDCNKRHIWDKLVDCVQINVRSWVKDDDGNYIDGLGKAYMGSEIKPRNPLTKDVFIDESTLSDYGMYIDVNGKLVDSALPGAQQYDILNHYAEIIAEEYLLFYGRRHYSYDMKLQEITWNMLSWDLTNTFSFNNKRFFITSLEFDLVEGTCTFQLVSIDGYTYNRSNILISKSPEAAAQATAQKSYNNYGGSNSVINSNWDGSSKGLDPALGRKSLQLATRETSGNPKGVITPLYIWEDIFDPDAKKWYRSTGLTDQDWVPLSFNDGDDIVLESGVTGDTAGQVIVKQPGTSKNENKYFSLWHDGVNAFIKAFTGWINFIDKIVIKSSIDTNNTKQMELSHDGTHGYIDPKTGMLKTNNKSIDVGSGTVYGKFNVQPISGGGHGHEMTTDGVDELTSDVRLFTMWKNAALSKGLWFGYSSSEVLGIIMSHAANSGLAFWTHNGSNWGERFRIDTDGKIKIPTLSASQVVESDSNQKLTSVTKGTAYNKDFGIAPGYIPEIGFTLGAQQILETNANGKLITSEKATAYNKNFGSNAGDVCQGNDSRLSDSRPPSEGWNAAINYNADGATINDTIATTALGRSPRDGDVIRETGGTPKIYKRISGSWYQIA